MLVNSVSGGSATIQEHIFRCRRSLYPSLIHAYSITPMFRVTRETKRRRALSNAEAIRATCGCCANQSMLTGWRAYSRCGPTRSAQRINTRRC